MENGNAINNDSGEEIYTIFSPDGLFRVYRDNKVINTCLSLINANEYIRRLVDKLNEKE